MGSKPKAPKPTKQEIELQNRQREELAGLDEEENIRIKRGLRGQLGSRRLLSSAKRPRSGTTGGGALVAPGPTPRTYVPRGGGRGGQIP